MFRNKILTTPYCKQYMFFIVLVINIKVTAKAYREYTLNCKDSYGDSPRSIEIQGHKYCEDYKKGFDKTEQVTITGIDMDLNFGFRLIII